MPSNTRADAWVPPFPRRKLAVLPPRPPAVEPPAEPATHPLFAGTPGLPDAVRLAEALGVPWERILREEIRAEQALRRYMDDLDACPLTASLTVLSFSFLQSWRVRDRIQSLACEARGVASRAAVRRLRAVFQRLSGRVLRDQAAFAEHLWFAYQRVLLLQRVCRAAARSRGTAAERSDFVCAQTRCSSDDAAWAVCLEGSRRQGHRLDAAIRKVRDEGFQIPRAESEARAFARLRSIVRASRRLAGRRPGPKRKAASASLPARVALPADAV